MIFKNMLLISLLTVLAIFLLVYGETGFSLDPVLVWQLRLPKVIVCFFAGGMLAIAGLLMQIFFQNPLAGPDILGISSGSSLFVAFWMMASASFPQEIIGWGMSAMSFIGAVSVFSILIFFVHKNMPRVSLIIAGLLISSFASSGISILISMGQALQLKNYLIWSMGSFRNVTSAELPRFIFLSLISIAPVIFFVKPLNQFLLSENYAKSMGVNIKKMRMGFIIISAFQISIITLFCGPIGFIGVIAPHLARKILRRSQVSILFPVVFFLGTFLAFIAEAAMVLVPSFSISVNAILGLIGAPIIVFYLYQQRERGV